MNKNGTNIIWLFGGGKIQEWSLACAMGVLGYSSDQPFFGCILQDYWHLKSILINSVMHAGIKVELPMVK